MTTRLARFTGLATSMIAALAIGCGGGAPPSPIPSASSPIVAPTPTPAPSPTFAGQVIDILAKDRMFSLTDIKVDAGEAFEVRFENQDPFNHAFYIIAGDVAPSDLSDEHLLYVAFRGDYFAGPLTMTHHVAALVPGRYTFFCPPHVPMQGTLLVK